MPYCPAQSCWQSQGHQCSLRQTGGNCVSPSVCVCVYVWWVSARKRKEPVWGFASPPAVMAQLASRTPAPSSECGVLPSPATSPLFPENSRFPVPSTDPEVLPLCQGKGLLFRAPPPLRTHLEGGLSGLSHSTSPFPAGQETGSRQASPTQRMRPSATALQ